MKEEGGRQKVEEIPLAEWVVPRVEKAMPADFPDEPYLGLDDIEAHTTRLLGSKSAADMKSSAKRFFPGDVLYSRLRPYLNKVWLADRSGLCSAEFIVLPSNDFIDGAFLKYRLNARDFVSFANSLNAGDRPRVDFDQISAFCLPPFALARQRRIVLKIEELFSELDAGEAALKKARHQLGVYRQSLLKQAFEGKLTAPWRAQHPDLLESPDQLLTRIQAERQARYERQLEELEAEVNEWEANGEQGRKPTRPKAFAPIHRRDSDESGSIPAQWLWLNLGDASDVTGGLTKNSKRENLALRIPYLRVANVYANELRLDEIKEIGVTTAEARKVRLEAGDLLIVEGNGSLEQIGRVASWNGSIKDCGHQNHLIRSRCFPSANHSFILMFLLSPQGREQIEKQAASTSGLHTLSVSKVHALSVPLCSLPEQQEIVRLLDEQFEVIEQNEHEIGAALKRSAALRQSILKKAFTGHLVPQDSTDEPASALLERIRSERENSAIVPKKKTVRKNFKSPVSPFHE